jgi:ribosomal protein S18 acetylase RimI-like enzyme
MSAGDGLTTQIVDADFSDPRHARAVVDLLNSYACDPMGGGEPLAASVQENLVAELQRRSAVRAILAFAGEEPAGLALCMEGFSTFACKPLLNVHDFVVIGKYRGRGVAKALMARVEQLARRLGCCKITLEVLEGNIVAQALYRSCGFAGYKLDPNLGNAMFWQRWL